MSVPLAALTQRLSATPRGARLARHLTLNQLQVWGIPYDSDVSEAVAVIVAELAANAVTHGRVPGRDFELRLSLPTGSVRIEVSDTLTDQRPPKPGDVRHPDSLDERGRGLVLVEALADRWEVVKRDGAPGKAICAEVDLPGWLALVRGHGGAAREAGDPTSRAPSGSVRP
ncbi:ATP-binding protein [Streptomyces chartreusis]|uniref:ATP-binding protein n=1 Tax=Streptomyces chartreusis TaxID=1969 RepID=UPI0036312D83